MENQIILSKKNCHRAARVRNIEHPGLGEWAFEWRKQNLSRTTYLHHATKDGDEYSMSIVDNERELSEWEVVSWLYEVNLEEFWDLACRAFSGTSFSPEERAMQYIRDYEKELNTDLANMPENEKERYIAKYKDWVRTLFDKHSRIMSAMITGPARFPTRRNEKMNNYYDSAVGEFREWREKALKAIARRIEDVKPIEQKEVEEWERVKSMIDNHFLPTNLYNKLETIAKNGNIGLIEKAIEYVEELNKKRERPIFTSRHKFWKLAEVAQKCIEKKAETESKENVEIEFEGGKVVKNFSEDRLQLVFPGKPDSETISKLKSNGFRWSPRFMAWQRQLTDNSFYACSRVIPVTYEQLKAAR